MTMERITFEIETKFTDGAAPGTFSGYGSVFGVMDLGGDIMMPGAFTKTLGAWRKKKSLPSMLWQHRSGEPIGVWTSMKEDERGLTVEGELILDDVPEAKKAYALMKRGAVKGLSIGYCTKDCEIDRKTGARRLKEVDLYEVSLVTMPMLPEAQVSSVKSFSEMTIREVEEALESGTLPRLSSREAKAFLAGGFKTLKRERDAAGGDFAAAKATIDAIADFRRELGI